MRRVAGRACGARHARQGGKEGGGGREPNEAASQVGILHEWSPLFGGSMPLVVLVVIAGLLSCFSAWFRQSVPPSRSVKAVDRAG
jgi:hypothetical protein